MRSAIIVCVILGLAGYAPAAEPEQSLVRIHETDALFSYNMEKYQLLGLDQPDAESEEPTSPGQKSGLKAALMSAVLPGAGEYYARSYWKTALFAALEIAAITGYLVYDNKGDNEDRRMKDFGDTHWSEQRYWSHVYNIARRDGYWTYDALEVTVYGVIVDQDYTSETVARLRDIERNGGISGFTHSLPETKTQQYYEMIYKYLHQFGAGWDDIPSLDYYETRPFPYTLTPNISAYRDMRNRSNDYYQMATTMTSVVLLNHLVSAFDAAITVKKYNKKIQYAFNVSAQYLGGETVRTYGIHLSW